MVAITPDLTEQGVFWTADPGQAKSGDAPKNPHQAASMCAPHPSAEPTGDAAFPTEFCLTLIVGIMSVQIRICGKGSNSLQKPADPIILGTSPMNYRANSCTLFRFWPLNFVPIFHGQL